MIKLLLLIVVVVVSAMIGVIANRYYKERVKIYQDFVKMCSSFKNEIYFLQTDSKSLIKGFSCEKSTSQTIESFLENGGVSSIYLRQNECAKMTEFFKSIGSYDVGGEIKNLDYWDGFFQRKYGECSDFYTKYGGLILKLSIITGAIVSLLLL